MGGLAWARSLSSLGEYVAAIDVAEAVGAAAILTTADDVDCRRPSNAQVTF